MRVALIALSVFVSDAIAICLGFNYAIGNMMYLGDGIYRWNVYDDACNVVDGLTTTANPCDSGIFGCSAPPTIFDEYTRTFTGVQFRCRTDTNPEQCGSDIISVCCSKDGN